jgi:hypothetical protein
MVRKNTNLLLQLIENGQLDKDMVITACLLWMSDSDVREMAEKNEFLTSEDSEETITDWADWADGDHDSGMRSAGWGTDEDYGYSGDVDDGI